MQKFKELLKTFNQADIVFVKSLLEAQNIPFYVNNENVNMVGMLSFAEPMRIMVAEDKLAEAKLMLGDFKDRFTKLSDLDD